MPARARDALVLLLRLPSKAECQALAGARILPNRRRLAADFVTVTSWVREYPITTYTYKSYLKVCLPLMSVQASGLSPWQGGQQYHERY